MMRIVQVPNVINPSSIILEPGFPPTENVRIMTWNLEGAFGKGSWRSSLRQVVNRIVECKCDVVCLQNFPKHPIVWCFFGQVLHSRLGEQGYAFSATCLDTNTKSSDPQYDKDAREVRSLMPCILSKYEMKDTVHWVNGNREYLHTPLQMPCTGLGLHILSVNPILGDGPSRVEASDLKYWDVLADTTYTRVLLGTLMRDLADEPAIEIEMEPLNIPSLNPTRVLTWAQAHHKRFEAVDFVLVFPPEGLEPAFKQVNYQVGPTNMSPEEALFRLPSDGYPSTHLHVECEFSALIHEPEEPTHMCQIPQLDRVRNNGPSKTTVGRQRSEKPCLSTEDEDFLAKFFM